MIYSIIVSPRAQKEIENTIDFYALYSENAPSNFILQLQKVYATLESNPFFIIKYKNIRSLKLDKFPYSLFFIHCCPIKKKPKRWLL